MEFGDEFFMHVFDSMRRRILSPLDKNGVLQIDYPSFPTTSLSCSVRAFAAAWS
jgi:hypothetical protein